MGKNPQEAVEMNTGWPWLRRALATNEKKESGARPPLWDRALTRRAIAQLRSLIGLQSASDHIVMVTNGITKLTDHFVLDAAGKESGRRRTPIAVKCLSLCALHFFLLMDKQSELHKGREVNEHSGWRVDFQITSEGAGDAVRSAWAVKVRAESVTQVKAPSLHCGASVCLFNICLY